MRKFLLSAATFLLGVGGVMATVLPEMATMVGDNIKVDGTIAKRAKAADANATPRWECSFMVGNSPSIVPVNAGTYKAAVIIPEEIARQCVGSQLKELLFYMGPSKDTKGKVFITKGLGGETILEKEITMNLGSITGGQIYVEENEVILDEPYVFTGEEVAIGYEFNAPRSSNIRPYYPLICGNETAMDPCCDNVAIVGGAKDEWVHAGQPLTIMLGVEGENLPTWILPVGSQLPFVVKTGEPADVMMQFYNVGATKITTVTTTSDVDGVNPVVNEYELNIASGVTGQVLFKTASLDKEGIYDISAEIIKANNMEIQPIEIDGYVKSIDKGVKRRVLVEEWTGTWCQYCPQGIWGMEYMKENYPDDFIGIAVHSSNGPGATDPMNYSEYINSLATMGYVYGFPGALVDRMTPVTPNPDGFKAAVQVLGGNRAFADISIEAKYVDEKETMLRIDGSAKIAYDPAQVNSVLANSKYRVSFVITENKVPGTQTNYFAGKNIDCGGWESMGPSVKWEFDEVARKIDTFEGIEGLLPDVMEKDKEYTFTHNIELPKNVKVGSNIDIIAMLINGTTGFVENAVKIAGPLRAASIDNIAADGASSIKVVGGNGVVEIAGDCVSAEIYGINGVRVASVSEAQSVPVAAGLYIVRTVAADGSVATAKVSVR